MDGFEKAMSEVSKERAVALDTPRLSINFPVRWFRFSLRT
jgi:hypothetical protein